MLELIKYSSQKSRLNFLENQDLSATTLVVSDLSSKLHWQNFLLKKQGHLLGPQVLRAEDLWQILLQRAHPKLRLVSGAWLTAFLKQQLQRDQSPGMDFALPYVKPSTAVRAINELLPILCHPDTSEVMEAWFNEVQESKCAWERWYHLAKSLWNELNTEGVALSDWSAAYLLQCSGFEDYWQRDLIVDLGPELKSLEVELLQILSNNINLRVLVPEPEWIDDFHWVKFPYEQFRQRTFAERTLPPIETTNSTKTNYKRFPGPLGEIKFAVGQIRQWLDKGLPTESIAIIAPDIEEYWPMLRWHLTKDNIPFNKNETITLGNAGTNVAWLSALKKICGVKLKSSELQLADFHPLNFNDADYQKYKTQWTKRSPCFSALKNDPKSKTTATDFLQWAIQTWPQSNKISPQTIEACKRWVIEAKALPPLNLRDWIEYLEDYLNNLEVNIPSVEREYRSGMAPNGVSIYSLMNGIPSQKTFQIILGCSESQLKSGSGFLSGSDVMSLQHHTGHLLAHPDRDFREYQLHLIHHEAIEQHFTFSESDYKGTELVPSIFWLNGRETLGLPFNTIDQWPTSFWEYQQFKESPLPEIKATEPLKLNWDFTLSPATLRTYVSCPFRFFAEKGLKLVDPAIIDLDVDPRTMGTLQHHLLELLTQEPFQADSLNEQLKSIVEKVIETQEDMFFSEKTKTLFKLQLEELGARFIRYEENYRKEYSEFHTLAREAWFRRDLDLDGRKIGFRGKIDRVDISKDQRAAIVIDYKMDLSNYHNAASWLVNLEYQLLAYTDSVERGAVEFAERTKMPALPVIAAHYLGLKDLTRKGFTMLDEPAGVVSQPTKNSGLNSEEKILLLRQFNETLMTTASKIANGDFAAQPHPSTDCKKCPWRKICRAPKQNL